MKIGKELGLDALRMSLARVRFYKPCSIVLDACKIGNQENDGQLQGIADSTGCKVSALAGLRFWRVKILATNTEAPVTTPWLMPED